MVSDLFHSPTWGVFHLSLTVLVHYRSAEVFSLGAWSPQIPATFHVDRGTQVFCPSLLEIKIQDFHLLWYSIPEIFPFLSRLYAKPYNPPINRSLGCSVFAHRYLRNLIRFLFFRVLRCFTSPNSPPLLRKTSHNLFKSPL
jgi:hypothetical protein